MSESNSPQSRRQFLQQGLLLGGATLLWSACGEDVASGTSQSVRVTPSTRPSLPDNLNPEDFIQHGLSPLTLETRRERLGMGPSPVFHDASQGLRVTSHAE